MLKGFYQWEEVPFEKYPEKPEAAILEAIASVRGCLAKGGEIDFLKAANLLLENFRNGKIGDDIHSLFIWVVVEFRDNFLDGAVLLCHLSGINRIFGYSVNNCNSGGCAQANQREHKHHVPER